MSRGIEDRHVEGAWGLACRGRVGDRASDINNSMQSFRISKPQKSYTQRRSNAKSTCDRVGLGQSRTKRELKNATTRLRSRRVENTSRKIKKSSKEAFYVEVKQSPPIIAEDVNLKMQPPACNPVGSVEFTKKKSTRPLAIAQEHTKSKSCCDITNYRQMCVAMPCQT